MYQYVFLTDELKNYDPDLLYDYTVNRLTLVGFSHGYTADEALYNLLKENPNLYDTDIEEVYALQIDQESLNSRLDFYIKLSL
ncbi:MAG: hypothetical protein GX995_06440 [Clostridiales bacterium]|jgi:hypothetical protein|nr:hypothetical protein [Clostridiales bacterium]